MGAVILPIVGLLIMITLIVMFETKENILSDETKIYRVFLYITTLFIVIGLVTFCVAKQTHNLYYVEIFQKLYMGCLILLNYLSINYCLTLFGNKEKMKKFKWPLIISAIIFIALVFVLPLNVIFDHNILDGEGPSYNVTLINPVISFVFFVIITAYLVVTKQSIKKVIPFITLIFLYLISFLLRIWFKDLIFEGFFYSYILLIMYHTIENPDVKMIKQLELAREQADKANAAKTDFLSSMSHEIRTPLNAINGFSNLIEESQTLEEAKANAKDIINASDTLLEIVNGILDISKIEAGKLEIKESPYNARETFEELAKLITPRMEERGLDFTYYIAPDLPSTLYGDHANVKKIVTNFLSNACKYTERGFVRYEVNCVNTNDKCKLIISVEDSGRGIKKENVDKLFTKFDRLDIERNTTIEGTGLGLAITKQLVELMGGKIIVHTVYGEGSKFTVMLDQKIEKTEILEEAKPKSTIDLKNTKILLVDDNELNLKVGTKMLERYGCSNVTQAHSGFECLDLVKENQYDLILLDDMMPKMSGRETLVELRKIPDFSIPVVALTANAISGMREKYLEQGFDEYLAKPIEKEEFIKVLNKTLSTNTVNKKVEVVENSEENVEELEPVVEESNNREEVPIEVEEPPEIDNETFLRNHGVDMDKALELLGDMEMYNATFSDFEKELESKWSRIEQEKLSGDMENYSIDVHSLKSDCKYLGFYDLADVSYEHELKSKENDIDFVNNNFDRLENEYAKVLHIVKEYKEKLL